MRLLMIALSFSACSQRGGTDETGNSGHIKAISLPGDREHLFTAIHSILENVKSEDTTAYLFLPIDASCPACRDKTIDSILKYKDRLDDQHYIIISAPNSKTIYSYFRDRDAETLSKSKNISLDSADIAFKSRLVTENPVIYYSFQGNVFRQVNCSPATIKKDLKSFFKDL